MQITRDVFGPIPSSPIRELYGNLNGILIAPIDIILFDSGTFNPPSVSGSFNGANVLLSAGTVLGTIARSPWPPTNAFDVEPFVKITPNSGVNLATFPDISSAAISALSSGSSVQLLTGGSGIQGKIVDPNIFGRSFITFSFRVNAFTVQFNEFLLPSLHGSRIVLAGQLIGMLISTRNNPSNGTCDALVYPANLVG